MKEELEQKHTGYTWTSAQQLLNFQTSVEDYDQCSVYEIFLANDYTSQQLENKHWKENNSL